MTSGIYLLSFKNTDKVYIGQSLDIMRRFRDHKLRLVKGIASSKLQFAYNKYGEPELHILVVSSTDLDRLENDFIYEFNSVNNGFNVNTKAGGGCSLTGEDCGNSVYSNKIIEESFLLLVTHPEKTSKDISNITGVSKPTIDSLSSKPRKWLYEKYPEHYETLKNRTIQHKCGKNKTLKERGIVYPNILSPLGISYTVENTSQFAKEHGLNNGHLVQVLKGQEKQHKGWRLQSG